MGKTKAVFFQDLGYTADNYRGLEEEFLLIARREYVSEVEHTEYGTSYMIDGKIRDRRMRTVWFVGFGSEQPHLVTAYPVRRKK